MAESQTTDKMQKSFLCIGGSHNGERVAVPCDQSEFSVAVLGEQLTEEDWQSRESATDGLTIKYENYKEEVFYGPKENISVWVPRGQTPHQTMMMLLNTYELYWRVLAGGG